MYGVHTERQGHPQVPTQTIARILNARRCLSMRDKTDVYGEGEKKKVTSPFQSAVLVRPLMHCATTIYTGLAGKDWNVG